MRPPPLRLLLALGLVCSTAVAAETTPKEDIEAGPQRTPSARSMTEKKAGPARVDRDGVTVKDGGVIVSSSSSLPGALNTETKPAAPKDPAAAAVEAEKVRVADEAAAFAKGEGERYARRQQAYAAARAAGPARVAPPKASSLAQLALPDGRHVVLAGGNRMVFPTKAAADAHVAEIRRTELERPIVLEAAPKK